MVEFENVVPAVGGGLFPIMFTSLPGGITIVCIILLILITIRYSKFPLLRAFPHILGTLWDFVRDVLDGSILVQHAIRRKSTREERAGTLSPYKMQAKHRSGERGGGAVT